MRNQPDLFDPLAYPRGPGHRGVDTSVAAAESMKPHVGKIQGEIVVFLRALGRAGATYDQIMRGCGLGAPTVSGRMVELVDAKLVKIAPGKRLTDSKRKARVYVAAEFLP